jgi:16S rRNA (guanine1516-N2)-methyltransferase
MTGLQKSEKGLSYFHPLGELYLDFVGDRRRYQKTSHRGKNELIAKALGRTSGVQVVWDLTAGLCEDSLFLLQLGFEVHAVERNPIIAELAQDARSRALPVRPEFEKFHLYCGEAEAFLKTIPSKASIYFDPMFSDPREKSALPRKEMQIFRDLVGKDPDAKELLQKILSLHSGRVVVKRPLKAEALREPVTHSFKGSSVRYDLYSG